MIQGISQSYSSSVYASSKSGALCRANPGRATPPGKRSDCVSDSVSPEENVTISAKGNQLSKNNELFANSESTTTQAPAEKNLTLEELKTTVELQKRDTEVRTHEQAHLSAAGQYAAGGASFSYVTGPDGKRYANGGEVPIDMSKEKTPEATIQKMRTVRRAALAPANPSGADRSIAAQASSMETAAMKELQTQSKVSAFVSNTTEDGGDGEGAINQRADDVPGEKWVAGADSSSQISGVSRKSMTSAYQAMAAFAA